MTNDSYSSLVGLYLSKFNPTNKTCGLSLREVWDVWQDNKNKRGCYTTKEQAHDAKSLLGMSKGDIDDAIEYLLFLCQRNENVTIDSWNDFMNSKSDNPIKYNII